MVVGVGGGLGLCVVSGGASTAGVGCGAEVGMSGPGAVYAIRALGDSAVG